VGDATANTKSDKFGINCNGGTAKVSLQVRDNKTNPEKASKVRIRGAKTLLGLASAPWSTDTNDTDALFSTPILYVVNGATTYYFEVNKTAVAGATGAETYTARIHCLDSAGGHNPDDQSNSIDFWYQQQ
jgi:hypothetical protein